MMNEVQENAMVQCVFREIMTLTKKIMETRKKKTENICIDSKSTSIMISHHALRGMIKCDNNSATNDSNHYHLIVSSFNPSIITIQFDYCNANCSEVRATAHALDGDIFDVTNYSSYAEFFMYVYKMLSELAREEGIKP